MTEAFKVGIAGLGVVGGTTAKMLIEQADLIASRFTLTVTVSVAQSME